MSKKSRLKRKYRKRRVYLFVKKATRRLLRTCKYREHDEHEWYMENIKGHNIIRSTKNETERVQSNRQKRRDLWP